LAQLAPFWQQAGLVPDPCPPETQATLARIVPLIRERLKLLTDVAEWTDYFFRDVPLPPAESLIEKKMTAAQSLDVLVQTQRVLAPLSDWSEESLERVLRGLVEEIGLKTGQVFGTIRTETTGKLATPPLFGILSILGRETVLARLAAAENVIRDAW
jgi:glutamyl-tRNA synthetase